ncbi:MAG: hypothetical protein ACXWUG_03985 [Polyangiales bacterium]
MSTRTPRRRAMASPTAVMRSSATAPPSVGGTTATARGPLGVTSVVDVVGVDNGTRVPST